MPRNSREKRRDEGNETGQREGGTRKGGYRFLPHLPDGDELLPTLDETAAAERRARGELNPSGRGEASEPEAALWMGVMNTTGLYTEISLLAVLLVS
jgi:hypothetical protein